jgi:hypothetical protein
MQYGNIYAPAGFAGIPSMTPTEYVDKPFVYPFDATLLALQTLTNQTVPIQTDADWYLRGIVIASATGSFTFRYSDSNNYFTSSGQIQSQNMSTFMGDPFVVLPEIWYPAGGKITVDITDTSNAGNAVELAFIGYKRFKVNP